MSLKLPAANSTQIAAVCLLLLGTAHPAFCCPEDIAERVVVPNSSWVVEAIVSSCSALDAGTMQIVAKNATADATVLLAKFGEIATTKLKMKDSHELVIELPNLVDMVESHDHFVNVKVMFKFDPRNDPVARSNYQLWLHDPNDPRAVEWFRQNIQGRIVPGITGAPVQSR
jgi:hypothetical protein